jgi:hypothetical protein
MSNNTSPNYITNSLELLIKIAEYGDVNAQKMLGWHYLNGLAIEKNTKQAFIWNSKAAKQNDIEACFIIGWHYENGVGVEISYKDALEWYGKAARKGHTEAALRLAELYFYGTQKVDDYQFNIEANLEEAIHYSEPLAKNGNTVAQRIFALCLIKEKDFAAIRYLGKASKQGDLIATERLIKILERMNSAPDLDQEIYTYLAELIEIFDRNVEFTDCVSMFKDIKGFVIYFYQKAIEQGSTTAEACLMKFYDRYKDDSAISLIANNNQEAQDWKNFASKNYLSENLQEVKNLALEGDIDSQLALAKFYRNSDKTKKWLEMAALQGDENGQYLLAHFYEENKNYQEALNWYRKCNHEHNLPEAQERMSYFFEHGFGVEQNEYLAYFWAKIAADNGNNDARDRRSSLSIYSDEYTK